jgi:hypothetical protein
VTALLLDLSSLPLGWRLPEPKTFANTNPQMETWPQLTERIGLLTSITVSFSLLPLEARLMAALP